MKAYLHTSHIRPDGSRDCFLTREVELREKPLAWQIKGLQYTATGYGSRIPTRWQIKVDGRWLRVYCIVYSNAGTLFIGKKYDGSAVVQIWED